MNDQDLSEKVFPDLYQYDLASVAGVWKEVPWHMYAGLHLHACWVGSVLHRSCTTSHNDTGCEAIHNRSGYVRMACELHAGFHVHACWIGCVLYRSCTTPHSGTGYGLKVIRNRWDLYEWLVIYDPGFMCVCMILWGHCSCCQSLEGSSEGIACLPCFLSHELCV